MRADLLSPNPQCTRPRAEIILLAVVKVHVAFSSLSNGGYSGGESEALSERNNVVLLLDKLRFCQFHPC